MVARRLSRLNNVVGRTTDTAIKLQYPMWVMRISDFVRLTKLEPHQKLRAENKIVEWDPSMKSVFFLSHQWTSFSHPDATTEQLRAMQRIFLRMMSGKLPNTSPCFSDAAFLPTSAKVTSKEWKTIVSNAYVWVECVVRRLPALTSTHLRAVWSRALHSYISVPQIGEYLDGNTSDLMRAVASIPAYVERSSHLFAAVPTVKHADLEGVECGLGSWLDRGWVLHRRNRLLTRGCLHGQVANALTCVHPAHSAASRCTRSYSRAPSTCPSSSSKAAMQRPT